MPASSAPPVGSPTSGSSGSAPDRASGAVEIRTITLPDTEGRTRAEAEAALRGAGVQGEIHIDADPGTVDFAVERVCSQVPGGGRETSATLMVVLRFCKPTAAAVDHRTKLVGLDVAEATQRARAAGFTGTIEVIDANPDPACQIETVCHVDPERWELNQARKMTLYINHKLKISTPE